MRFLGSPTSPPKRPRTAPGERIYAIGDVHGRFDLLQDLLGTIERHEKGRRPAQQLHVVLLGDVIDRGPDSAAILRFLQEWSRATRGRFMLQGNHEEVMLRVHGGERALLGAWLRMGGRETLQSFGIEAGEGEDFDAPRVMRDIAEAVPADLMNFVRGWPVVVRSGDFYFCHAGVRPGVELERQARSDLMWIREEFLASPRYHGATIVHGHSITSTPDIRPNRIGIDTGAYRSGVLTALFLEDGEAQVLSTAGAAVATPYADA